MEIRNVKDLLSIATHIKLYSDYEGNTLVDTCFGVVQKHKEIEYFSHLIKTGLSDYQGPYVSNASKHLDVKLAFSIQFSNQEIHKILEYNDSYFYTKLKSISPNQYHIYGVYDILRISDNASLIVIKVKENIKRIDFILDNNDNIIGTIYFSDGLTKS